MSAEKALHDLFGDLFGSDGVRLRNFLMFGDDGDSIVRSLPAGNVSFEELAICAIERLRARGLMPRTFERLRTEYARRLSDIDRVASMWPCSTSRDSSEQDRDSPPHPGDPVSRRETFRLKLQLDFDDIAASHAIKQQILAILKEHTGDSSFQIEKIWRGSVWLEISADEDAVRALQSLIAAGKLTRIAGGEILEFAVVPGAEAASADLSVVPRETLAVKGRAHVVDARVVEEAPAREVGAAKEARQYERLAAVGATSSSRRPAKRASAIAARILGECIAYRLRIINRAISKLFDEALRPFELRIAQFNTLAVVMEAGGLTPGELSQRMHMDPSTVSRNVERMCNSGWLKLVDIDDARSHEVQITEKGMKLIADAAPAWEGAQRQAEELLGMQVGKAIARGAERLTSEG